MTHLVAVVAAKSPVDAWVFWLAAVIAALGIIWRAMRPLRDVGVRNRNIHDAVLGTAAVIDQRTGTVLKQAQPGLVTSLRELTETIARSVDDTATIRRIAADALAAAKTAAETANAAAEAARLTREALQAHERECAAAEGTAMWRAIDTIASGGSDPLGEQREATP